MSSWEERAKRALDGEEIDDVELIEGRPPPIFDARFARSAVLIVLAPLMWAAAILREQSAASPIDPFAMAARAIAIALTLRLLVVLAELRKRLHLFGAHKRYRLALTDEGLVYQSPGGRTTIAREDVVEIREPGDWGKRQGGRRFSWVYLVMIPREGRGLLAIPPVLETTPGVLAERLMRWRGPVGAPEQPTFPEPEQLGSKTYDAAAEGKLAEGMVVVRHGWGWVRRGPYAALLLGIVFADGLFRFPDPAIFAALGILPWIALGMCAVVPLGWLWLTRRHVAPRKGLAFVATGAEILMRTRAGVLRTRWKSITDVRLERQPAWSVFEGYRPTTRLVLDRGVDNPPIRYDEAFLGIPAEIAAGLIDAYRRAQMQPTQEEA